MKGLTENRDILDKIKWDLFSYKCTLGGQIQELEEVLSMLHELNHDTTYINRRISGVISKIKSVLDGDSETL